MKLETKWKWFKRFAWLIALASGGLIAWSFKQWDFTLFVAALSLGLGGATLQVMIGFIDAFMEEMK
jgi:hypothetical protein